MESHQQLIKANGLPSLGSLNDYVRYVKNIPDLTQEEENFLLEKLHKEGSLEAAKKLITSQLKTVVWIAQQHKGYGIPIEDLIQEGNIGLMKAVKNYDMQYKVRLYTYALIWIKSEMQSYIIKNWRLVKIATTNSLKKLFFNFKSLQNEAQFNNLSDHALIKNIAQKLDVSDKDVLEIKSYFENSDLEMDSLINEQGEQVFQLQDNTTPYKILEDKSTENYLNKSIQKSLNVLDEREKDIILMKFFNDDKLNNKEIANKLNISSERVRQIEKKAFDKIKPFLLELK